MPTTPAKLLASIESGSIPPVILVGGDNEYLSHSAWNAIRERIVASNPDVSIEPYPEGSDLGSIVDSFRTMSLFGGQRLLLVPEVNAFVTRKELDSLLQKAVGDWTSAKTERKRTSAVAKLLHVLGLVGADLEESDDSIAEALAISRRPPALGEMLSAARSSGKKPSRGEGDAALLSEAVAHGGANGTILLMRTGEIPLDSATVAAIDRAGAVVVCNLTQEEFPKAFEEGVREIVSAMEVSIDVAAVKLLQQKLGIERVLTDKFSKEVPDLRMPLAELERLATFVGRGGRITARVVDEQIASVAGGARYEFASLYSERKPVEAIAKLRDLVAQSRRDDPNMPVDMHFGKYLFALAEEVRQLIGVRSFVRKNGIDPKRSIPYNRFKESLAPALGEFLVQHRLARQRLHPFALFRKFEAAAGFSEQQLLETLEQIAKIEVDRKSGGIGAELGLESLVLSSAAPRK
ncbi:MAG: hypothetical protein WBX15_13975 [Thermoanaerobaculia bacterium]